MKFSIQNLLSCRDWQTHAEVYFMGAFSRGGLGHDRVRRSLQLFAEKVMPRFA